MTAPPIATAARAKAALTMETETWSCMAPLVDEDLAAEDEAVELAECDVEVEFVLLEAAKQIIYGISIYIGLRLGGIGHTACGLLECHGRSLVRGRAIFQQTRADGGLEDRAGAYTGGVRATQVQGTQVSGLSGRAGASRERTKSYKSCWTRLPASNRWRRWTGSGQTRRLRAGRE